ncbi:MAG: D-aminoacyl-tRNA deacylase [Leptospiraceae bacterium]
MYALIQRVLESSVKVNGAVISSIGPGMLIFLGAVQEDSLEHAKALAGRIGRFRIFEDSQGKMNLSVQESGGAILVVSQFTLCADLSRGNRPSFGPAAAPGKARQLYDQFCSYLAEDGISVKKGEFGADMKVHLINDGPVTFMLQEPR